ARASNLGDCRENSACPSGNKAVESGKPDTCGWHRWQALAGETRQTGRGAALAHVRQGVHLSIRHSAWQRKSAVGTQLVGKRFRLSGHERYQPHDFEEYLRIVGVWSPLTWRLRQR